MSNFKPILIFELCVTMTSSGNFVLLQLTDTFNVFMQDILSISDTVCYAYESPTIIQRQIH